MERFSLVDLSGDVACAAARHCATRCAKTKTRPDAHTSNLLHVFVFAVLL